MSISTVLATLAVCTVLLDNVTATGVIAAPSTEIVRAGTFPAQCPTINTKGMDQPGNDLYVLGQVSSDRLTMFDVQMTVEKTVVTVPACMELATSKDVDAFQVSKEGCHMYNFAKGFCPCDGTIQLYVNKKRLENNEFSYETPHRNEALDEIVFYSEIPPEYFMSHLNYESASDTATENCEKLLLLQPVRKPSLSAILIWKRCFVSYYHDVANCNQPCRGKPLMGLVRKENPNTVVHFLSNCGKTLQVTAKSKQESSIYLSHPGTGCYYYPEPNTPEEDDCIITFVKAPTAERIDVFFDFIELSRNQNRCKDQLILYSGHTTDQASLLKSVCEQVNDKGGSGKEAVTINFRRNANFKSTDKFGFFLSIFNA